MITHPNQGKECVLKHMHVIDWRIWTSYLRKAYARSSYLYAFTLLLGLVSLFQISCSLLLQAKFAGRHLNFSWNDYKYYFVLLTGYTTIFHYIEPMNLSF